MILVEHLVKGEQLHLDLSAFGTIDTSIFWIGNLFHIHRSCFSANRTIRIGNCLKIHNLSESNTLFSEQSELGSGPLLWAAIIRHLQLVSLTDKKHQPS